MILILIYTLWGRKRHDLASDPDQEYAIHFMGSETLPLTRLVILIKNIYFMGSETSPSLFMGSETLPSTWGRKRFLLPVTRGNASLYLLHTILIKNIYSLWVRKTPIYIYTLWSRKRPFCLLHTFRPISWPVTYFPTNLVPFYSTSNGYNYINIYLINRSRARWVADIRNSDRRRFENGNFGEKQIGFVWL